MKTRKLVSAMALITTMSFTALSHAQVLGGGLGGAAGGAIGGGFGGANAIDGNLRGGFGATGALDARGAMGTLHNADSRLKTRAERLAEKSRTTAGQAKDVATGTAQGAVANTAAVTGSAANSGVDVTQSSAAGIQNSAANVSGATSGSANAVAGIAAGSPSTALNATHAETANKQLGSVPAADLSSIKKEEVTAPADHMNVEATKAASGNASIDKSVGNSVNASSSASLNASGSVSR